MLASSGEITDPWPRLTNRDDPVLQDTRLQPLLDEADDALVTDALPDETDQPILTDRIEKGANICVQNEVHFLCGDPDCERIHCIVRTAPRPEPVAEPEEIFLVDRVQYGGGSPLYNLILESRDMAFIMHLTQIGFGNERACEWRLQSIPAVRDLSRR